MWQLCARDATHVCVCVCVCVCVYRHSKSPNRLSVCLSVCLSLYRRSNDPRNISKFPSLLSTSLQFQVTEFLIASNVLQRGCENVNIACSVMKYYNDTYLLTHSIQHSPSWEANRFSASQEIPHTLWNPKVHYRNTSARQLSLFWTRSIQFIPSHPTSWRSILIFSSPLHLVLPSCLFLSSFPTRTSTWTIHKALINH